MLSMPLLEPAADDAVDWLIPPWTPDSILETCGRAQNEPDVPDLNS